MSTASNCIEKQVKAFCAQIGADPLLVQGAGGNVSWKDGDVLWVKASGTWLVDAESKDIFVPVNLAHLQDALAKRDFFVKPEVNGNSGLRPSIETLLHALMPHKVVAHLHAVEMLAYLVQVNARQIIKSLVADSVKWIYIDYFKPGVDLARAISEELANRPGADVVFMANHGVVIGGSSVDDVLDTLHRLIFKMKTEPIATVTEIKSAKRCADFLSVGYVPCADRDIRLLTLEKDLYKRLSKDWALYPDHVVFLGAEPAVIESACTYSDLKQVVARKPAYIFCKNDFVYESTQITAAQRVQLRCYYDVIIRQALDERLSALTSLQVKELLGWDAEKYRQTAF
jgi:rhamnose utilization protein RhaD (predicted bifunctional aldolase and dehydrogenase)